MLSLNETQTFPMAERCEAKKPAQRGGSPEVIPLAQGPGDGASPQRVQGGARPPEATAGAGDCGLCCPAKRAEGGGHFLKPRMLADGAGKAVHAGIDSTEAQAVAGGVGVKVGQGAGLTALAVVADG